MITAIDTNVLIDVLADDKRYARQSLAAIEAADQAGALVICEIVLAEIALYFKRLDEMMALLDSLKIQREPLGEAACFLAGQTFLSYRRQKGPRKRILADFLIAAHAQLRCTQLLTRDRGFYRSHFPKLKIIDTSE
jgi:hypothetical protein